MIIPYSLQIRTIALCIRGTLRNISAHFGKIRQLPPLRLAPCKGRPPIHCFIAFTKRCAVICGNYRTAVARRFRRHYRRCQTYAQTQKHNYLFHTRFLSSTVCGGNRRLEVRTYLHKIVRHIRHNGCILTPSSLLTKRHANFAGT